MTEIDPLPRIAGDVALRRLALSGLVAFQTYRQDPVIALYQGWTSRSDAEANEFLSDMGSAPLFRPGLWSQVGIAERDAMELIGDIGAIDSPLRGTRHGAALQENRPMLQLRPNCECCNRDLPPQSEEALICSFECAFCRGCATAA